MVELGTEKTIKEELKNTLIMVKTEKNNDVRLALYNYIGNLYSALSVIEDKNIYPDEIKVFGSMEDYKRFNRKTDFFTAKFIDNFIANKSFHQDFLNDILVGIESIFMANIDGAEYSGQSDYFGEKDFWEVFYDFCSTLKLNTICDEIMSKKKIFPMKRGKGYFDFLGLTLHNPISGDSNILVNAFDYNLDSMYTLVHELGHYYDLLEFNSERNINELISYSFESIYQEVFSRLFERLLIDYLIKNGIKKEKIIDKLIDFEILNHDFILSSYILSLLKNENLIKEKYIYLNSHMIIGDISKYFCSIDALEKYLENSKLDLMSDINYAYGDILSMFLRDNVLEEGLDSPLMRSFRNIRWQTFSEEFILREGFTPSRYIELYKKEIQLIKK